MDSLVEKFLNEEDNSKTENFKKMSLSELASTVVEKRENANIFNDESIRAEKQLLESLSDIVEKGTGDEIVEAIKEVLSVYTYKTDKGNEISDKSNLNAYHRYFSLMIRGPEFINSVSHLTETIYLKVFAFKKGLSYDYEPEFGLENTSTCLINIGFNKRTEKSFVFGSNNVNLEDITDRDLDVAEKVLDLIKSLDK